VPSCQEQYEQLSNEELYLLLRERFPERQVWPVTDEVRNTVIAILKTLLKVR
jgi:hypothetical protein